MSVKIPITGTKYVEYIAEDRNVAGTWGVLPTTPTFKWVGLAEEFIPPYKELYEEKDYLGASGETHKLELHRNINADAELTASLKYVMQDWDLIEFITGSMTGFSDTVDSVSVVAYIDEKWIVLKGGMLTKWAMTVPESGVATVDVDFMFGDILDPSSNDPSANGHASESATTPFIWKDITALKMDANEDPTTSFADIIGDIGVTITNEVKIPKDIDSTYLMKGSGVAVIRRDVEISLELIYTSEDLMIFRNLVANHTKQNLTFKLGRKKITVKGLLFDDWIAELKPAELVGQTITAITDLASLTMKDVNILFESSSNFAGPEGISITHNGTLLDYMAFLIAMGDHNAAVGEMYIDSLEQNSFLVYNSGIGRSGFRWMICNKPYAKGESIFAGSGGQTITHTKGDTNYVPCIIPSANGSGAIGEWWITDIANTSFVVRNSGSGLTAFKWAIPRFEIGGKGASSFAGSGGVTITHNLNISGGYTPLIIPTENPDGHLGAVYVTDITANTFIVRNTGGACTAFTWLICNLP